MEKSNLSIAAFVSEGEQAAIQSAADYLARALSEAADVAWTCDVAFSPDMDALQHQAAAIIVTSLLPEVAHHGTPWPESEQRLRKTYAALVKRDVPLFICTVLRHVDDDDEAQVVSQRVRIRQLNLLAAEISRETRSYVIDLDRVVADIGARRLQTDYRLSGQAAADMAGHFVALTLVNNALDALVSFEVQDAARAILVSWQPRVEAREGEKPEVVLWKNKMLTGKGRKKQVVAPVLYTVSENHHAGWLVGQVLRGTIGPRQAVDMLFGAIRRRGVRGTAGMVMTGLTRQFSGKK
jgi:hypothetical protein